MEIIVSTEGPKFSKIITVTDANKLSIPDEFLRKYGQNLPEHVFLHTPDGSALKVAVIKSNRETWLDWKKFRVSHSITVGNFLLFEYDHRTSRFNVVIETSNAAIDQYRVATVAEQRQVQEPVNDEGHEAESDADGVACKIERKVPNIVLEI